MGAGEGGGRKLLGPGAVRPDDAVTVGGDRPFLAEARHRRADFPGTIRQHLRRHRCLGPHHHADAGLENSRLLAGDHLDGIAEELDMVPGDRRDHGEQRARQHVGRIQPAAKPVFDQGDVAGRLGEGEEGAGGGHLEEGDGMVAVGGLALFQQGDQGVVADRSAGGADALVEADEMGRGVGVDPVARGFEHGPKMGDDRTLAVGAGDMQRRRHPPFGIPQRRQQALDPSKREVDLLGMKGRQTADDIVTRRSWGSLRFSRRHSCFSGCPPPEAVVRKG